MSIQSTLMKTIATILGVVSFVGLAIAAHGDLFDQLKSLGKGTNQTALAAGALSHSEVADGLKAALSKGVERAVASLGHSSGFLTNLNVKILMPEKLRTAEKTLRALGQAQMADDFIASMNHAAEQAVPVAASVFGDSIKQMSIENAKGILAGTTNAATQYFRRTTETNLFGKFYPIVQKETDKVGVTIQYKQLVGQVNSAGSLGGLFGSKPKPAMAATDIDAYVTHRALDGLFLMVAEEEKRIRENPAARTTDLLKKVFGSATK